MIMPLRFVDVSLMKNDRLLIEFSDGSFAGFTAKDLMSLARFLRSPGLITHVAPHEGIALSHRSSSTEE
jgi:hypothetical protein